MKDGLTWDEHFMFLAYAISMKSKDDSTKIGCVAVGSDNEIRSTGYNGLPRGVEYKKERFERPNKYFWFEHSERNTVYNATRIGVSLKGCRMYVTSLPPCADCARAIIQAGITEVVIMSRDIPDRWKESCGAGLEMLKEAKIKVRVVKLSSKIKLMIEKMQEIMNNN